MIARRGPYGLVTPEKFTRSAQVKSPAMADGSDGVQLEDGAVERLLRSPPLWYYVLREAAARASGDRLGPVGGRIVAEVLIGLLEADPHSYLRQAPTWQPHLGPERGRFEMPDLVRFTEGVDPPGS